MFRNKLLILILLSSIFGFSQQLETSRFEVDYWSKNQSCHFEPFGDQGGMMVNETDKTDEYKNRLWSFMELDTSFFERHTEKIPLPDKLRLFDSKSSPEWATFVFVEERASRSESVLFYVVTYHRPEQGFDTFSGKLPGKTLIQAIALIDGTLMLSVNYKTGKGFLLCYDLDGNTHRIITPHLGDDFIQFSLEAFPEERLFVLAARQFVDKHYKSTAFQVYSKEGQLLQSERFENIENAGLGRMCLAFDDQRQLVVFASLEREGNKKVSVEGMTEDFNRISVGVIWIKFTANKTETKTYLFKNLPEIETALTASDRLRVKEEMLKMKKGKKREKGEIAFQLYAPRLVRFGDQQVFVAEAFQPVYHVETRVEYNYYGSYPVNYTVFDGYDFFSQILLSFNQDGMLQWYNTVRFENDLTEQLFDHASEAVCHDELVVASPSRHSLRYEVFDSDGTRLLEQEVVPLDFLYSDDSFEDEFDAGIYRWYGDRFLVHGCQIVQNPLLRNTRRSVYYVQKVQYE